MTLLRRVPVRIAGAYQPVSYVGHIDWKGTATADEPITALAMVRAASGTHWSRAGHHGVTELDIELRVRPRRTELRKEVTMTLLVCPVSGGHYRDGSAHVDIEVQLTSTAPFIFFLNQHETGAPTWFAHAWSKEEERFGALFVAESDTRSARNHLWHLRDGIEGPDATTTVTLMRGRSGVLGR
jgi:hypothetical protein